MFSTSPPTLLNRKQRGCSPRSASRRASPFAPDARLKAILTDAVAVGNATARAIVFAPRDERTKFFPDRQWTTAFVGGSHEFMDRGERMLDMRALFHYYATGITPAMAAAQAGHRLGVCATPPRDSRRPLLRRRQNLQDHTARSGTGRPVLVSFTVYDTQTRSMLETDQKLAGIDSTLPGAEGECRRFGDGVVRP